MPPPPLLLLLLLLCAPAPWLAVVVVVVVVETDGIFGSDRSYDRIPVLASKGTERHSRVYAPRLCFIVSFAFDSFVSFSFKSSHLILSSHIPFFRNLQRWTFTHQFKRQSDPSLNQIGQFTDLPIAYSYLTCRSQALSEGLSLVLFIPILPSEFRFVFRPRRRRILTSNVSFVFDFISTAHWISYLYV